MIVKRIVGYKRGCVLVHVCEYIDFLTSGVFFLNSRLRSISFFLDCSLSSCLLASCVAVASSSFCNTNTQLFFEFSKNKERRTFYHAYHCCYCHYNHFHYHRGYKKNHWSCFLTRRQTPWPIWHAAHYPACLSWTWPECCSSRSREQNHNTAIPPRKTHLHQQFDLLPVQATSEPFSLSVNLLPLCQAWQLLQQYTSATTCAAHNNYWLFAPDNPSPSLHNNHNSTIINNSSVVRAEAGPAFIHIHFALLLIAIYGTSSRWWAKCWH